MIPRQPPLASLSSRAAPFKCACFMQTIFLPPQSPCPSPFEGPLVFSSRQWMVLVSLVLLSGAELFSEGAESFTIHVDVLDVCVCVCLQLFFCSTEASAAFVRIPEDPSTFLVAPEARIPLSTDRPNTKIFYQLEAMEEPRSVKNAAERIISSQETGSLFLVILILHPLGMTNFKDSHLPTREGCIAERKTISLGRLPPLRGTHPAASQ